MSPNRQTTATQPTGARTSRRKVTYKNWLTEAVTKFGPNPAKWKFICPACHTAQSIENFRGLTTLTTEQIKSQIGFSCIGRHSALLGCDWTLGGLLHIHTVEIIRDGQPHPFFEFADSIPPAIPEATPSGVATPAPPK